MPYQSVEKDVLDHISMAISHAIRAIRHQHTVKTANTTTETMNTEDDRSSRQCGGLGTALGPGSWPCSRRIDNMMGIEKTMLAHDHAKCWAKLL